MYDANMRAIFNSERPACVQLHSIRDSSAAAILFNESTVHATSCNIIVLGQGPAVTVGTILMKKKIDRRHHRLPMHLLTRRIDAQAQQAAQKVDNTVDLPWH